MIHDKTRHHHCIFFAFQLKKTAAEAAQLIYLALGKDTMIHKTCEKWSKALKKEILNWMTSLSLVSQRNLKTSSYRSY